jgi:hypothetical protein
LYLIGFYIICYVYLELCTLVEQINVTSNSKNCLVVCNGDWIRLGLKWAGSKFLVKMTRTKGFRNSKTYPLKVGLEVPSIEK